MLTLQQLGLVDEDSIDVFYEQLGGAGGAAPDNARDAAPEADTETAPKSEHINIIVKDQQQNEMTFKIKRTTTLKKLMDAYCDHTNKWVGNPKVRGVRFMADGEKVMDDSTPASVR